MIADRQLFRNDANISAAGEILSKKQKSRVRKFKLLGYAQKLLIDYDVPNKAGTGRHRTRHCHAAMAYGQDKVTIKLNTSDTNSEATFGNLQTCGSIWSCPVCASRIAVAHGREIVHALNWAEKTGFIPVMVTLTAGHASYMRLRDFKASFKTAWRQFTNTRNWRFLKKHFHIEQWICNREVTHGNAGWHYHQHMLLFINRSVMREAIAIDTLQDDLSDAWLRALSNAGLCGIEGVALTVTAHGNVGQKYLVKLGLSEADNTGELEYELTGAENKKQSGRNVWDLLRHAYYGDELADLLYLEYVQAMAGDNWITWSHGFHDIVAAMQVDDDSAAGEPEAGFYEFWKLPQSVWYRVKKAKAYGELLEVAAASRDRERIRSFLTGLRDELLSAGEFVPPIESRYCPVCYEDWLECDCHE